MSKVIDATKYNECQLAPSLDYLSKADFLMPDGKTLREHTVTVEKVEIREFPIPRTSQKEYRPVVKFIGRHKKLVIGAKCNRMAMKNAYGEAVEGWYGKEIVLWFDPTVKFGKEITGGIRIKGATT